MAARQLKPRDDERGYVLIFNSGQRMTANTGDLLEGIVGRQALRDAREHGVVEVRNGHLFWRKP